MPQSATRTRKPATRRRAYKILGLALLLLTLALALPATASAFISTGDGATWSQGNSGSDDWFHGVDAKLSSPSSTSLAAGVVVAGAYGDSHPDASTYWAREGGAYDFGGLSAGSHRIELRDDANGAYAAQYRNNKPTFSSADNVAVTAGATTGTIAVTAPGGTGAWTVFGTSPGSFAVTGTAFTLNVTAPTGTSSYAAGTNLTVRWTTSSAVSTGQFGVWARSSAGGWYVGQLVPASGGASSYVTYLTLDVPIGSGYEAVVAWRAAAGSGAWTVFGTSPGSFAVTEFAAEGHVTGTVTNAGGVGLAGISVNAHRANASGTWDYVNGTSTAAGGAYDIGGLPTGTYRIRFYDNSGAYVGQCYDNKAMLSWADNVAVTAGATTPGINAVLAAGGHITGTVTNAAGAALAGITVVCNQPDGSGRWWGWSTDTDANGAYDFGAVSSGSHRIWFQDYSGAYAAQYYNNKPSFETADNVAVTAGATTSGINAVLAAGGRVTGTVTNAAGAGLAGIFVSAYRDDGSGGWYWVNRRPTAAGGAYNLGGLPAGTYRIEFEGSGAYARQYYNNKPTLSSGDDVVVTAGATTPGINATLIPPSALTVTGFTPTSGAAGTAVTINGSGFTGATRVTFNGTAATSFTVVSDTQITATVPTAATSGTIAVTTPNGTGVSAASFTVTGTAFTLNVTAPTGTSSYAAGTNLTVSWTTSSAASSGEFGVWARSSSGSWYIGKLVAASGGSSYSTALTLDVPANSGYEAIVAWRAIPGSGAWTVFGTSPGSFAVTGLAADGHITGTVTNAAGVGLAGISVFCWGPDNPGSWSGRGSALTDVNGAYDFGGLNPASNYRISFYDGSGAYASQCYNNKWSFYWADDVAVTAGATTRVDAVLTLAGHVTGTVTNAAGAGVAGISLIAYRANGSGGWSALDAGAGHADSVVTAADGTYDLGRLPAGICRIMFVDGSGAYLEQYYNNKPTVSSADDVAVAAGATTPGVNAVLAVAGHVTGTVTNAAGAGLANIYVWASRANGSGGWGVVAGVDTAASGAYDLGGLPTGSYRIEFWDPAGSFGDQGAYATQYYNNKPTIASADNVAVTAGATTPGINAVLAVGGHVTGTVTNAGGAGLAGIRVYFYRANGSGGWDYVDVGYTVAAGALELGGLPAGTYRIWFRDDSGTYAGQYYNNKPTIASADDVAVTAGATTPGINAVLTPTLATTVTSFLPAFGPGGASGILTGTGFTGAPAVRFNGTAASYTVNSATQLTATVPAGATSGTIAVTAPNGTCTSPGSFTCPARVNSTEPYLYRAAIGGIETTYPWYWSSSESEYYQDVAWYQYFDDGNQLSSLKYGTPRVRAVRAF